MRVNIAIDLSTTKSGICWKNPVDNEIMNSVRCFWDKDKQLPNVNEIGSMLSEIATRVSKSNELIFLIELSNFSNAELTNKFNMIAGAIIGAAPIFLNSKINYKLFNSSQWHNLIGLNTTAQRGYCKILSRLRAYEYSHNINFIAPFTAVEVSRLLTDKNIEKLYSHYSFNLSDDYADSYNIWRLADMINDRVEIKSAVKERKVKRLKDRTIKKLQAEMKQLSKIKEPNKQEQRRLKSISKKLLKTIPPPLKLE